MRPLSVYVHIPFCLRKCAYCDFPSFTAPETLVEEYLKALKIEIEIYRPFLSERKIETVYFGGGTPSLLKPEKLLSLLDLILSGKPGDDLEVTLEANPGTVNLRELKALKEGGFNRISIGAQSFQDSELALLGRIHNSAQAREAFEAARKSGFENINLDLIFGLPGQSLGDFLYSLNQAVSLAPEHLSLYCLSIEKGTPLFLKVKSGELHSLGDDLVASMYHSACRILAGNRYEHYEISNFAQPGYRSRHNMVYWTYGDYLGFGLKAVSFHDGIRRGNLGKVDQYIASLKEGKAPIAYRTGKRGVAALREEAILRLRTSDGFLEEELRQKYPRAFPAFQKKLLALKESGLLEESKGRWRIRERYFFVSLEIMARLM
ncbi:MAG: radical SAM family heme chaperone HemW [Caldiserica bacterium]|jgi:oxygen-independent coproporphyrinogen-3 oxidase|nr:radical SAM family heme chaperone HemW [Caldisericota bacterium]